MDESRSTARLEQIRKALDRHAAAEKMPDVWAHFVKLLHELDEERDAAVLAEREACAVVCSDEAKRALHDGAPWPGTRAGLADRLAAAIRARTHTP